MISKISKFPKFKELAYYSSLFKAWRWTRQFVPKIDDDIHNINHSIRGYSTFTEHRPAVPLLPFYSFFSRN